MHTTKISGLAVDTQYSFHLVLRTTAGTYTSDKVDVQTHKMTDLSGITITTGILPQATRESLAAAVGRIGAKIVDSVRIDTTHFVTTEGRGIQWEKAVEMNIPVVRPEWVDACEQSGRILGVTKFYLDALRPGPPSEDRPGTAGTATQQPQAPVAPAATTPSTVDKELPAAPPTANGHAQQDKEVERQAEEEEEAPPQQQQHTGAQEKEVAVEDDRKESSDEEDEPEDKTKAAAAAENEQTTRVEDKEQNLTARPKAATVEDADAGTPSPASRSSFQEVQL